MGLKPFSIDHTQEKRLTKEPLISMRKFLINARVKNDEI